MKHFVYANVTGAIKFVSGQFEIDDADFTKSKFEAVLDAKSVNTNNETRDSRLRLPDFFNTAKFGQIKFVSEKITAAGLKYKVVGYLYMRGKIKEITLTMDKPSGAVYTLGAWYRGISATGTINRRRFGMDWNKGLEAGGLAVGEDVDIAIEAELVAADSSQNT